MWHGNNTLLGSPLLNSPCLASSTPPMPGLRNPFSVSKVIEHVQGAIDRAKEEAHHAEDKIHHDVRYNDLTIQVRPVRLIYAGLVRYCGRLYPAHSLLVLLVYPRWRVKHLL